MSNGKVIITHLIAGLIKNMFYSSYIIMSEYFPKPYRQFDDAGVHTSNLAEKSEVASLKAAADKIDVRQIKNCFC